MTLLFPLALLLIVECSTIGKKIKVPDSDATLQQLIYKSALPRSNEQILDSVWWVPNGDSYQVKNVYFLSAEFEKSADSESAYFNAAEMQATYSPYSSCSFSTAALPLRGMRTTGHPSKWRIIVPENDEE